MAGDLMLPSEMRILFLRAMGAIVENGLQGQHEAIEQLTKELTLYNRDVMDKLRLEEAGATFEDRLKPGDGAWAVHMTHCYGRDEDDELQYCKYGEDDICPAALFNDPLKAYNKWKDDQKTG